MYKMDAASEKVFEECMESMKYLNKMFLEYKNETSKTFGIGRVVNDIVRFRFHNIKNFIIRNYRRKKIVRKNLQKKNLYNKVWEKSNYFSNEKIVIYTVIFGKYDAVYEPIFLPDNCEYIIVTDMEIAKNSKWKKYDLKKIEDLLEGLDSIEKNRILKMKPELLFPEYKYSVYIDGNIQIITDITEMIYKIPECGIAMHLHNHRDCIYEEIEVLKILKRETRENLDAHLKHILIEGMPHNYGLLECNVIVREHNNERCKKIMNDWWEEFLRYSKRDQISFPYVLYKNGIKVEDVAVLGNNVRENYALRIYEHIK